MDDERRKKIEAGKSKWAEFKKKKNKSDKSPANAVSGAVKEKNYLVDQGVRYFYFKGILNSNKELLTASKNTSYYLQQSKINFDTPEKPLSLKNEVDIHENAAVNNKSVSMSADLPLENDNTTSTLSVSIMEHSSSAPESSNSSSEKSTSFESSSLFLEGSIDECEVSSGSDNSTITGISPDSSKSESSLLSQSPEKNSPEIKRDDMLKNEDVKEDLEEKLPPLPTSLNLSPVSDVQKTYFDIRVDDDINSLVMGASTEDNSSFVFESNLVLEKDMLLQKFSNPVDADDHIPFLNDEAELVSLYDQKIKKYQEAIQQRDSIISQLSSRLESAMNVNQAAESAGTSQVEKLKEEINLLQLKMKETAEILKKQKLRNGCQEYENCGSQTEIIELNKCETGVQVEADIISLLESIGVDDTLFMELFIKKYSTDSESCHQVVHKLNELLISHFSPVHLQEFMTLLKNHLIPHMSDGVLERTSDNIETAEIDPATILKKITCLNMVAKLIESLINISCGNASDTFPDFSPSKFQSFFLKRLHSVETGDVLQDASESESQVSDFNYAEVETPCTKPVVEPSLSIEKLRKRNIAEEFSIVTEFLQDEMERICSFLPSVNVGAQGDGLEFQESDKESVLAIAESNVESDHQKILLHRSKLEANLKNLKSLDKELHSVQHIAHQTSLDSDTLTISDDNLLMEEPPLSCISLLSLTDSEYKTDYVTTDSEANFSRKVSLDMTRSMQEKDVCGKCERHFDLLKEKYENDIMYLRESLENSYSVQKNELLESIKNLESEIDRLRAEKGNLKEELDKQIELLCSENEMKIKCLSEQHTKELYGLKTSGNKLHKESEELRVKLQELQEKLTFSNKKVHEVLDEKAHIEITLQNQIADLIQEHEQDLEAIKLDNEARLNVEKKHLENNYRSSFEVLKKVHEDEINDLKCQIKKEFEEKEQNLLNDHARTISMIEAAHCDESAVYQKKIEQLLEEKCELLSKTTQEYETILKKNHRALVILCKQLLAKLNSEKDKVLNESIKSGNGLDITFSDAFDQLNKSLENGLVKFLNQNYFMNSSVDEFYLDETEYLPIELSFPIGEDDMPPKIEMKEFRNDVKKDEIDENKNDHSSLPGTCTAPSESSMDSDDIFMIHSEINKLQEEFQKDVTLYKNINEQLHLEIKSLRTHIQELEDQKENLVVQLQEKDKEIVNKDALLSTMDAAAVKGGISGSQLSATDIRSWQVHAAQTNSRLLHVLSDLVKTFLDIEHDINTHLLEYGLIPTRSGALAQHDDDTGQSVGSREDFTSLSLGECPNLELTEDGPDLTPRAWDVFATVGNYDNDLEGEDVVLGASRRLRLAVDHVLNLLSRAIENQQSQDLKLLLKRNEELSHELQEESQGRDAVHMELVSAESTVRKLEAEKQRLEDINRDLKDDYEILRRELSVERNKASHLQQEKESALDEIHVLKEQCELLASRLGDPEKKLLQENSRLSSEKHTVQKNLSKERQSFLDRLHQMEIALEELNAEKDDLVEKKCKEIRDLKAEMEAMEKQLQSNKKFIELQAIEREQEREDFIKEINKMQDFVREKEKIQSNEAQLTKEIESLEQLLRARIEDHKNAMAKKDEVEKELRLSLDKIRDLRDVIEELEKQLDIKSRIECELRQKLCNLYESIPNQEKNVTNSDSGDSARNMQINNESIEQLHNLKEQLASQSQEIEMMSQSQTLLHELRGQIHFLEAKVEQRARQLEANFLSAASSPVPSGDTSPSGSQDSEPMQIPCEDGWEMSPRSIHWLEIRRLEEKIGRLVQIDEEMLKKTKDLEQQLRKTKTLYSECQHENIALQEKLSEQLMQISALKSHIDEQKHRSSSTPQKSHSFAEKIEELQEELEKQIENNKRLTSDLRETQASMNALQDEISKKDEMISILQKCCENISRKSEDNFDIHAMEEIKKELSEKTKLLQIMEKENNELKSDIDYLKTENSSLKSLLEQAEKDIETERAQVETLCDEMANLAENSKDGAISLNNSNTNGTNEIPLNEAKQVCSCKLVWEKHMKEKKLEILMLKATVTKLQSSMRSKERELEIEQKRLEQDFNTVQDMMQQKERELATLHEETEAQMKLEAELESLEKELCNERNIESQLREELEKLKSQLTSVDDIKNENEKKAAYIKSLEKAHAEEITNLQKQINIFKSCSNVEENCTDIEELVNRIIEAAVAFELSKSQKVAFQEILYKLLRNTLDSVFKKLKKEHEENVSSLNKSWQEKIGEEITSRENNFRCETEKLKKTFHQEREKLSVEKDLYWKEKIKDIELKCKNELSEFEKLYNSANSTKNEVQSLYESEINSLRMNLESALKEKGSLENLAKNLSNELKNMKQDANNQRTITSKNYETQLTVIGKTLQENFEKEKEKIIVANKQKIEQLQKELNAELEKEKKLEIKHKEELSALHKYFETRWANEMKKIQDFQSVDLKNFKDNSEKSFDNRLKKAKEEFSHRVTEERKQLIQEHNYEIQQLQEKFEKEKQRIIEIKEKEIKANTDILEQKFNANLERIKANLVSSSQNINGYENSQKEWEEEKMKLIASHEKEIATLKQQLKNKYEKQLQAQSTAHAGELKRLEETYNKQVEEVHDLIKEAKRIAIRGEYADSGSNRTTTPSSDVTSSDEACSSCQEDMLSANKHILVDKIHQDGKRVLSLIESAQPFSAIKEAQLWLEERKWIVNKLKTIAAVNNNTSLKLVISDLVDEVQKFRTNFEFALEENSELKEKYYDLEQQLSIQYSKFCDVSLQLKKQKATNSELESLLSSKTSELSDLKKRLEDNRFSRLPAEREISTPSNGSTGSSYEIGCLRSADDPRSAEKFSMFLPELGFIPSMEHTPDDKAAPTQEISIPKMEDPSVIPIENEILPDGINSSRDKISKVQEKLLTVLNKGVNTTDVKLHGLYWVYRRSQSYNKALIYQKKYLLMLLRGFQVTEKVTLAWLKRMDNDTSLTPTNSSLHPRSRFRAGVFVIIALHRMKFYVKRWRLLAKIPSSQVINVEIQSVFQNYSFLSPAVSPGGYHLSTYSLSSMPMSLAGKEFKSSQMSTSSRAENKSKDTGNLDKSQLIEYVHRLEILQKQLGLDNLR